MEPLGGDDPRRIGEYRLLRRLGAGGMGRVYLGRTAGGRTVAVKAVRGELADDPEFRARFRQEVAAARRVGGRWTAPVLDADTESDRPWVATGYVAGPALGAAVRRFGPLPEPAVRALGVGLAEALTQVHALELVHRDVKPSNVLLALDGPRLIDFGVARALDAATALTRSGYVVGSPGFMSPEQAAGEAAGPAGDVFSLGALLAFAATGVAPFGEGVSAAVLLYRVLHEEPDLADLDGGLREIVAACLAKRPDDRPTPAQLRERLAPGAASLGDGSWLPPLLAAAVGRSAVELLDLEAEAEPAADAPPGPVRTPTHVERIDRVGPAAPPVDAAERAKRRRRTRLWLPLAVAGVLVVGVLAVEAGLDQLPWQHGASGRESAGGSGSTPGAEQTGDGQSSDGQSSDGQSGDGQSSDASPSARSQDGASGGQETLPEAFVGTWKGTIVTKIAPLPSTFTVEFGTGRVGEVVGHTSNASAFSSTVCRGALTLLSAAPDRIELQERPEGQDKGCTGSPEKQTYTIGSGGTIHLEVSEAPLGSDPSGDLAKQ
ncbi:hypothetical protein GCM10010441_32220 [Kitasatospora paracochleata]|uniref:Protein kinase domain-containing protein n=1 Tax=Kitasatospora paracochleata TaxID=58354 RepID=A0ABT1IPX7_9ACTN|nr:serine/threonine-protein kinase [Kitasatospora paracochleata]MCP2307164.1 hypothetical protein [Kitasatospora paracochleata]